MSLANLRALHAIVGAAIDDIERVYRPSSRRASRASTIRSTHTSSSRSQYSTSTTDSDVDGDEADVSAPPTPTSPCPPNPSVRFASNKGKRGRERAQTLPPLPHPPSGILPPPILKQPPLDFPSLDMPIINPNPSSNTTKDPTSTETDSLGDTPRQKEWKKKCEELTTHPEVLAAVSKIVASCGQMVAIVQKPFLTLCDAAMAYHLPSCLRLLEASHIVEILREAGPRGMHVDQIVECISSSSTDKSKDKTRIDPNKLSHIMRLLATHHITREVRPSVFANNRISSVMDSGKPWKELMGSTEPEKKYEGTDGFAAFVGLCTDEIFKASAYLTDCYLLPERSVQPPPEASLPSPALSNSPSHSLSVPPRTTTSESMPTAYGIYTPNDSTASLPSPAGSTSPMTFAHNPSPHAHRRNGQGSKSHVDDDPTTPSPPKPHPVTRPRAFSFRRLSSRSTTPTPDTPCSPPLPAPLPEPETPRSATNSSHGSVSQNDNFDPLLNTPRSPPSRDSLSSVSSSAASVRSVTARKKTSFSSFGSLGLGKKASMSALAHAFGGGSKKVDGIDRTPTTPRSPVIAVIARSRQASAQGYVDGHMRYVGLGRSAYNQESVRDDGALGPAFDLRPPASATSPHARTFPVAEAEEETEAPFASMPPPVPPKPHNTAEAVASALIPSPFPPSAPHKSSMRQMPSPGALRHAPSLPALGARRGRASGGAVPPLPVSTRAVEVSKGARTQDLGKLETGSAGMEERKGKNGDVDRGKEGEGKGLSRDNEMYAPFNVAFETGMRYFEWLERGENVFRLKRFGKAMTGTSGWEGPGSVFNGFPWQELLPKSVIVDVGGGIGSTSMLLANAFPHLRFVIQDRPPVAEMGAAAWRERHPEMLDTGRAVFQAHDFFKPQPALPAELDVERKEVVQDALGEAKAVVPSVFLLRVITHDWPDSYVTKILLRLRQAAGPNTRLLLADYVLPLACVDEDEDAEPETPDSEDFDKKLTRESLPGTVRTLAPEGSPLLPNLGKASAVAYWLDLCMRVMFNSQERTLRELAALTLQAGWKITQVSRAEGSLFGHIVAVPVEIPPEALALPTHDEAEVDLESVAHGGEEFETSSPPMGETFLTSMHLPTEDAIKAGMARGKAGVPVNASEGGAVPLPSGPSPVRRRERANTFTGNRTASGRDSKSASEAKKGWRSIVKMLSKSQVRSGGGAGGGKGGVGMGVDEARYALTRQPSKG